MTFDTVAAVTTGRGDLAGPSSEVPAGATSSAPPSGTGRPLWRKALRKQTVQPVVGLIAFISVWQLWVRIWHVSVFIVPAPSDVWQRLLDQPGTLWDNAWVTFKESVFGLALALIVGISTGICIAYSGGARRVIYPYLVILQVTPIVATAPLLSIWFGFGLESKIIITFLVAFFPITVGMATGLRSASSDSRMLMRSLASSPWDEFRRMRLPYALVHLVAGLRIAAPATVIGAIIAEFVSSSEGLGYMMIQAQSSLNTPLLFLALLGASIMGLLFFGIVNFIEYRWLSWHESTRDEG